MVCATEFLPPNMDIQMEVISEIKILLCSFIIPGVEPNPLLLSSCHINTSMHLILVEFFFEWARKNCIIHAM